MVVRSTNIPVVLTTSYYGNAVWYLDQHRHYNGASYPTGYTITNGTVPVRTETINSVSTQKTPRIKYVVWRPRKSFFLSAPLRPTLHLSRLPTFHPPRRSPLKRSPRAMRRYEKVYAEKLARARKLFEVKLQSAMARRRSQLKKFELAMAKYHKRLQQYNVLKQLHQYGKPHRRRIVSPGDRPWTSYNRIRESDTGFYHDTELITFGRKATLCNHGIAKTVSTTGVCDWPMYRTVTKGTAYASPPTFPSAVRASALASAEAQATSRLHEMTKDAHAHIGCMLAERAQTISMLSGTVKALESFLTGKRSLLKLLSSGKEGSAEVANATLAFQFGVKPLLNDVYQAAQGLSQVLNGPKPTMKVKGHACSSDSSSVTSYSNEGNSVETTVYTVSVKVSYTMEFSTDNRVLSGLSQWGLVNPAEIAWELIPWSFAVDWIYPIGGWISSLTSDAGLSLVRGVKVVTITETTKTSIRHSGIRFGGASKIYQMNGFSSRTYVKETKTRTPVSFPDYVLRAKNPFSLNHLVDSIALLRQRMHF